MSWNSKTYWSFLLGSLIFDSYIKISDYFKEDKQWPDSLVKIESSCLRIQAVNL